MNNRRQIEIRRNRRKKDSRMRREEMINLVNATSCRDIEEFFAKQFPPEPVTVEFIPVDHQLHLTEAFQAKAAQILEAFCGGAGTINPALVEELGVTLAPRDFNEILGRCKGCGAPVASYLCNEQLQEARPEGAAWDYWASCLNPTCLHHHGEGYLQGLPDWIKEQQ